MADISLQPLYTRARRGLQCKRTARNAGLSRLIPDYSGTTICQMNEILEDSGDSCRGGS